MSKIAGQKIVRVVPVHTSVEVFWSSPRRFELGPEPQTMKLRGRIDFRPDLSEPTMPLWFNASVTLQEGEDPEVVSFAPLYNTVTGNKLALDALLYVYKNALQSALRASPRRLLGVS